METQKTSLPIGLTFDNVLLPKLQPPAELFETLQSFAERGITRFDEVYYLPNLQLTKDISYGRIGGR